MTTADRDSRGMYGQTWDRYVENWKRPHAADGLEWPGDEWGNAERWERLYEELFAPAGVRNWRRAVEIGPGSGKYTLKVLADSAATVRAYDVSGRFLEVCTKRCQASIEEGRLSLHLLDAIRPDQMLAELTASGWRRSTDAVFSIDAMVHVDLQYLMAYLITAGVVLKPKGKLILTLANATSERGFEVLLEGITRHYAAQINPIGSGMFEWLSANLVHSILSRLGFEIEYASEEARDLHLIAALADPARADRLEAYLLPPTPPSAPAGAGPVR